MKIVEPKYEILTDISEGGIKELQQIERVARVCYKSEDKHNNFAEKIPVIQNDIKVLGHRVTDLETHEHERS